MYRLLMRAARGAGDLGRVHRIYLDLRKALDDREVPMEPGPTGRPLTDELLQELIGTTRQRGSGA